MECPKCKGLVVVESGDVRCMICGARPMIVRVVPVVVNGKRKAEIEARREYGRRYYKRNRRRLVALQRVCRKRARRKRRVLPSLA